MRALTKTYRKLGETELRFTMWTKIRIHSTTLLKGSVHQNYKKHIVSTAGVCSQEDSFGFVCTGVRYPLP